MRGLVRVDVGTLAVPISEADHYRMYLAEEL